MEDGLLSVRGDEDYEEVTSEAQDILEESGRSTALDELQKAIMDLGRRPNPDKTGAITHSMAALECLARDISGAKEMLGDLIRKKR